MKKKLVSAILATVMAVSVTACGGNTKEPASTEGTTGGTEESAAQAESTGGTAAATSGEVDFSVLEGLTVGFSQCDNSSNWKIVETESIQDTAAEYGVNLIYTDASGDIAKQASDIEDMISQGADYIIVAPQEEDGLQASLIAAKEAGIGVILVDRGINAEAGVAYDTEIMSDFVWEAQAVADYIIETTGGEGNVVILEGTQGATSTTDRQSGFMDAIEGTNLNVIADQVANYSMPEAQEVMENILQAHGGDIDIIYSHGCDMALGALAAVKAAGYIPGEDIKIGTVDASVDTMEAILAGEFLCACSCSPFFGPVTFEKVAMMAGGATLEPVYVNEDTLFDINNADVSLGF